MKSEVLKGSTEKAGRLDYKNCSFKRAYQRSHHLYRRIRLTVPLLRAERRVIDHVIHCKAVEYHTL